MRTILLIMVIALSLFSANKPLVEKLSFHSHNHTHIHGSMHAHEHSHVQTSEPLYLSNSCKNCFIYTKKSLDFEYTKKSSNPFKTKLERPPIS